MKRMALIALVALTLCLVLSVAVGCDKVDLGTLDTTGTWYYSETTDGVILNAYAGTDSVVTVPALVDGKEVKGLGDGVFLKYNDGTGKRRKRGVYEENTLVTEVKFEAQVEAIPAMAFYLCSKLTKVTLPDTCKSIGDFAFYGCKSLLSIELPASCGSIGAYAFRECSGLKKVVVESATLPKIGDKCFYLVDNKSDDDDQYYVIPDLKIEVANVALYDSEAIEAERRKTKNNDYRYWIDYIDRDMIVGHDAA